MDYYKYHCQPNLRQNAHLSNDVAATVKLQTGWREQGICMKKEEEEEEFGWTGVKYCIVNLAAQ